MDEGIRKNIQKTATKLFLKYGLRSVSIDDICNELRMSKKTFYTYFSQKEELIDSVLLEHTEKQSKKQEIRVNSCVCNGNAIDYVVYISAFHASNRNKQFVNFFFDLHKYYPEIHRRHALHSHEKVCEQIRQNIQAGRQEGLYRSNFDLEQMTRYLAMQFLPMTHLPSTEISKSTMKQGFALILDVYVRVLCNLEGLQYYEKLLADKPEERTSEDVPMKDEELDLIIDRFLNTAVDITSDDKSFHASKR